MAAIYCRLSMNSISHDDHRIDKFVALETHGQPYHMRKTMTIKTRSIVKYA
jgi:hypothetical protein